MKTQQLSWIWTEEAESSTGRAMSSQDCGSIWPRSHNMAKETSDQTRVPVFTFSSACVIHGAAKSQTRLSNWTDWLTDCLWLVRVLAVQSCPTLCDPMDCSPPGSSVHGILQAKILEWVVIPFSRASSWPRDLTRVFHIADKFFTIWATRWDPQTSQLGQAFCFKLLCKSTIYAAGGGENWAKMSKKFTTTCFSVFLFGLGCSLISCLLVL